MPYSCWTTATSLWLRSSAHAATDVGEPLTISPMTRLVVDGGPSDTRTTLTSAPLAGNPLASAALNAATPHAVGGYVLRMLKLGAPENPRPTTGNADDERAESVNKVIPTDGCHRRVRRERLLGAVSGGAADSSRTSWVPN